MSTKDQISTVAGSMVSKQKVLGNYPFEVRKWLMDNPEESWAALGDEVLKNLLFVDIFKNLNELSVMRSALKERETIKSLPFVFSEFIKGFMATQTFSEYMLPDMIKFANLKITRGCSGILKDVLVARGEIFQSPSQIIGYLAGLSDTYLNRSGWNVFYVQMEGEVSEFICCKDDAEWNFLNREKNTSITQYTSGSRVFFP